MGDKILDVAKCTCVVAIKFPGFDTKSGMLCPVLSSKLEQRKGKTLFLLLLCVLSTIEKR